MRFRLVLSRVAQQQGIILLFVIAVATLWLAATGHLTLYIHQRYVVFTTGMAVVALVMASGSVITQSRAHQQTHFIWWRRVAACVMVCMVAGMALLVPPTALTTTTATQRGINKGAVTQLSADKLSQASIFAQRDYSHLTIKEWAGLLAQTHDSAFYRGKTVNLTGFVTPDTADSQIFYVSRFVVTCCAVDAQAVGVPVYAPGWRERYQPNSWVTVTGDFAAHPQQHRQQPIVIMPRSVTLTTQPKEPYEY
jgi:TIGR03943 family protein